MDLKPLYDVNSERQTSHDLSHMWILVFSVCVHAHMCVHVSVCHNGCKYAQAMKLERTHKITDKELLRKRAIQQHKTLRGWCRDGKVYVGNRNRWRGHRRSKTTTEMLQTAIKKLNNFMLIKKHITITAEGKLQWMQGAECVVSTPSHGKMDAEWAQIKGT